MYKLYMSHRSDNRAEVTRCGHKNMTTHVRGWKTGVRIESSTVTKEVRGVPEKVTFETFEVYITGGSNAKRPDRLIGVIDFDFLLHRSRFTPEDDED